MPIIRVLNWPCEAHDFTTRNVDRDIAAALRTALSRDVESMRILRKKLRHACVAAGVPGVDSETLVTVSFDAGSTTAADCVLVIIVEGLFDRSDRTKEIRNRLARMLGEAARGCLAKDWQVEVLVQRFNPIVEAYWKG